MKKRFTEEQIIRILREAESTGAQVRELCRRHNVAEQTFFRWRNKYGGIDVPDARKLKVLESENAKLKLLRDLREARTTVIESWRRFYNHRRSHSALGYLVPAQFRVQRCNIAVDRTAQVATNYVLRSTG